MLHLDSPAVRDALWSARFGLEREALRVTRDGRMSRTPHPFPQDDPRIVRDFCENLFWAFAYNVLLIPLAAGALYPLLGWKMHPDLGALAMSLSSFCVCANALRLNRFDPVS